jgi:hypothetical protein
LTHREVVDRDAIVLDILHDALLELPELGRCQRVGLSDDGDDVDSGGEAPHELDIEFSEGMASGRDEAVSFRIR